MSDITKLSYGELLRQIEDIELFIRSPHFIEKISHLSAAEQERFFMIMDEMGPLLFKVKKQLATDEDLQKFNILSDGFFEQQLLGEYRGQAITTLLKVRYD